MNKQQASRLLTLAYFLKTKVPRRQFDMSSISQADVGCNPANIHECGTSACGLGWATVVFPDLLQLGESTITHHGHRYCGLETADGCASSEYDPYVWGLFGISDDSEAYHLFGGGNVRTPKQEAKVIEDFVAKKGWVYETA